MKIAARPSVTGRLSAVWITLALGAPLASARAAPSPAQDQGGAPPLVDEERSVSTAEAEALSRLLSRHAAAAGDGDGAALAEVLAEMSAYDNPELLEPALAALKYRATREDRQAARALGEELGTTSKKALEALLAEREAAVQAGGAHVLANFPGEKEVVPALLKAFRDKATQKEKPAAVAALIRALGLLGSDAIAKDMEGELRAFSSRDVARAAVRYFGQVKTRDLKIVLKLCALLEAPEPAAVDDPNNPPAGFWAVQWETWSWVRRDVSWSLQQITGQVFRPSEGEHPSDAQKAAEYVKAHKGELGLR